MLLAERGKEPLQGYWSLPGGALETGETLHEGVKREILEETGLIVRPVQLVEVFERIMLDADGKPEYHYVLMDYLCVMIGGELAAADDVSRVDWVPVSELEKIHLTEGTRLVIEKAFTMRGQR